jgi:hypothetical protein
MGKTHRMFDYSHLGCIQHYTLLVGTDCIRLAARIEDSRIAGHLVVGSSFVDNPLALLHRIVEIVDLVGRIVLQVGKSSQLVETSLLVGFGFGFGSGSSVQSVLPGYPPVRQGHLPKNSGPTFLLVPIVQPLYEIVKSISRCAEGGALLV